MNRQEFTKKAVQLVERAFGIEIEAIDFDVFDRWITEHDNTGIITDDFQDLFYTEDDKMEIVNKGWITDKMEKYLISYFYIEELDTYYYSIGDERYPVPLGDRIEFVFGDLMESLCGTRRLQDKDGLLTCEYYYVVDDDILKVLDWKVDKPNEIRVRFDKFVDYIRNNKVIVKEEESMRHIRL